MQKGYSRHLGALFRVFQRLGFCKKASSSQQPYTPQHYDAPSDLGKKWQMDGKHVPAACYTADEDRHFFQYMALDEAERERFIYAYEEQSSYSTCDFIRRAIAHFGYLPKIIQTDNGAEFTHLAKKRVLKFYSLDDLQIRMKRYLFRSNNFPQRCSAGSLPLKNVTNILSIG
nr:DDE-type integrase/transposase/recombinase [Colibacter massiliensis]